MLALRLDTLVVVLARRAVGAVGGACSGLVLARGARRAARLVVHIRGRLEAARAAVLAVVGGLVLVPARVAAAAALVVCAAAAAVGERAVAVRVVTVRAVAVLGLERGAKHGVVRRLLSADALEKAIEGGSEGLLICILRVGL